MVRPMAWCCNFRDIDSAVCMFLLLFGSNLYFLYREPKLFCVWGETRNLHTKTHTHNTHTHTRTHNAAIPKRSFMYTPPGGTVAPHPGRCRRVVATCRSRAEGGADPRPFYEDGNIREGERDGGTHTTRGRTASMVLKGPPSDDGSFASICGMPPLDGGSRGVAGKRRCRSVLLQAVLCFVSASGACNFFGS